MSLAAAYVSSKSQGPFGWERGGVRLLHYHTVLPTSTSAMHLNIHRNLPPRLRRKNQVTEPNGLVDALRILDENRLPPKRFGGIKRLGHAEIIELSERLSKYNTAYKPAEGRGQFPPIKTPGSGDSRKGRQTKDMEELCSRLAAPKQAPEEEQTPTSQTPRSGRKMKKEEISALVERLSTFDPTLHPAEGRGVSAKERRYSQMTGSPRKLDQDDLEKVFDRLTKYNPDSWPPNSRDRQASLLPRGKTFSDSEVGGVVDRLTSYDTQKWPPESSGTREAWSDGNHWNFRPRKSKPAATA